MARPIRRVIAGEVYHVLNRGNGRMNLFHKPADFDAFIRVIREGLELYAVDLLTWCLMSNHWHLVLRPRRADALAGLMRWVAVTHVRRHHERYHTRGGGHLYQGRFKSFPVQSDGHLLTVCRYVESNPLRAKLVRKAQNWPFGRIAREMPEHRVLPIAQWPVRRPADWLEQVNAVPAKALSPAWEASIKKGRPFGDPQWVAATARRLGLGSSLRDPGRPAKGGKPTTDRKNQ